jgi:hypothetical protein
MLRMAREKALGSVINLRVPDRLSDEIKRIAHQHRTTESEAARRLLVWGVEAHRAMEAAMLSRSYDVDPTDGTGDPVRMRVRVTWETFDPADGDLEPGLRW